MQDNMAEETKSKGIIESIEIKVGSDDAMLNGIFPEGMPFRQQIEEYNRVCDEDIEAIMERNARMARRYSKLARPYYSGKRLY
jgi:hypothetical protein